jgi:dipeptidyl aminopeptidase/acylaminoacyl peptidase
MRNRRYWFKLLRLFIVALVGALILLPFGLGVVGMWALTHPPCNPGGTPSQFGMQYEDITFPSTRGVTQEGYFMPGTNGATVIIPPAYGNGRGGDLHYAAVFNRAGFNVITFNGRVCTSYGRSSMGYVEVEDVEAAYDYLLTRADVDPQRVTLHGFSSAGATSEMAMARMPEIRGVSAEGNYHDMPEAMGINSPQTYFDTLFLWASRITYRLVIGEDISVLSPLNAMDDIGARPVLLIYGSFDASVGVAPRMIEIAQAGGAQAELWIVEGAGHGGYMAVAGAEFDRRVVTFHCNAVGGTLTLEPTPRCD